MAVQTFVDEDLCALADRAFAVFCEQVDACRGDVVTVALCGGRFAEQFYDRLARLSRRADLSRLRVFLLDERMDGQGRNATMISRLLVKTGVIPASQLFLIPEGLSAQDTADVYTKELKRVAPSLSFDIIVASMGEDGHIASLFPGRATLGMPQKGYAAEPDSPKPPKERITLLSQSIRDSGGMLLFVQGEGKRDAYRHFLDGTDETACPGILVRAVREGFVFTDLR